MMEGFGVHTFRFVGADGRGTFVKLHWKPKLGTHSPDSCPNAIARLPSAKLLGNLPNISAARGPDETGRT